MTNLEALRNGKGWSRMQLCKIIGRGVTVRMIFSYEREGVNPDIDLLIAFADVFNVSVDFLLGRSNPDTQPYDELAEPLNISRFGERIQQFRINHNHEKKDIAEAAGITCTYLGAIENGRSPKLETAIRILNALGASADYAFMDVLTASAPIKSALLQDRVFSLPVEKRAQALNLIEAILKTL